MLFIILLALANLAIGYLLAAFLWRRTGDIPHTLWMSRYVWPAAAHDYFPQMTTAQPAAPPTSIQIDKTTPEDLDRLWGDVTESIAEDAVPHGEHAGSAG